MVVALLEPWEERSAEQSLEKVMGEAMGRVSGIDNAIIIPVPPSSIPTLGYLGGFEFRLLDQDNHNHEDLDTLVQELIAKANSHPDIAMAFTTFNSQHPHTHLTIDRDKALNMGVDINDIALRLQSHFGSLYISEFHRFGRNFPVILQGEHDYRQDTDALEKIFVPGSKGRQVPLSVLVTERRHQAPLTIGHFNMMRDARINGQQTPGTSLRSAMNAMAEFGNNLPPGFGYDWSGGIKGRKPVR